MLTAVKQFTYNAAADCWPGWSLPDKPPDTRILLAALELAQRSARLMKKLAPGPLQEATATWLCGAFDLALGRHADASRAFAIAQQIYTAAKWNATGPWPATSSSFQEAFLMQYSVDAVPMLGLPLLE